MASFLEIQETEAPSRFGLTLTPGLCVGPASERFMLGGIGLAAAIAAMEKACHREPIWTTAQFFSFVKYPANITLAVDVESESRNFTHASVVARVEDRVLLRAIGAFGGRGDEHAHQWLPAPSVPPPDECPLGVHWRGDDDGLHGRLEVRVAKGRYGRDRIGTPEPDGRLVLWVRPKEELAVDMALVAVIADLFPNGMGNALGLNAGGTSLDNTIRFVAQHWTEWLLVEIAVHAVQNGIGHGEVRIFAQNGALIATGSQSLVLRIRD